MASAPAWAEPPHDDEASGDALQKAADEGDADAQYWLGRSISRADPESERALAEAFRWYLKAAGSNHADAMFMVAQAYETGVGVSRDAAEAVRWYQKASELGQLDASFNLALMVLRGDGHSADNAEAARLLRPLSDREDPEADYIYGLLLREGDGIAQDLAEALRRIRRAADRGYAPAQVSLGQMVLDGEGTTADPGEARQHFLRAAEGENADAAYLLGTMSESGTGTSVDPAEARRWYLLASERGQLDARVRLGVLALQSPDGDIAEGVALLESASEAGSAPAHYYLGLVQLGDGWAPVVSGQHLRADPVAARRAFEAGAASQHAGCLGMLGTMLAGGLGGQRDLERAVRVLRAGAELGDAQAQFGLASHLGESKVATDLEESVKWLTRAAEQGHLSAMNDLGAQKVMGQGTPVDAAGAALLYERAAEAGHVMAARNVCELQHAAVKRAAAVMRGLSVKSPTPSGAGPSAARAACQRAVDLGDDNSVLLLAELLLDPTQGATDAALARATLERGAREGSVKAQLGLAELLMGPPAPNAVEALAWFAQALPQLTGTPRDRLLRRTGAIESELSEEQRRAATQRAKQLAASLRPPNVPEQPQAPAVNGEPAPPAAQ